MLSNQPVPEASGRIWATCYMDADTEIFEIRTENAKITDEIQRLYNKDYSFGISLMNFLYEDLEIFSSHLVTLK